MKRRKECGNCNHFVKWKLDKIGGGLCEKKDHRTKTDYGRNCRDWSGIKYRRKNINLTTIRINSKKAVNLNTGWLTGEG